MAKIAIHYCIESEIAKRATVSLLVQLNYFNGVAASLPPHIIIIKTWHGKIFTVTLTAQDLHPYPHFRIKDYV